MSILFYAKINQILQEYSLSDVGVFLFLHLVAKALSSAPLSLTSVVGMGTGGPSASSTPTVDNEILFWLPKLDSNQRPCG